MSYVVDGKPVACKRCGKSMQPGDTFHVVTTPSYPYADLCPSCRDVRLAEPSARED